MQRTGIILAAGDGSRMKSTLPQVLHEAGGYPMLGWVIWAFQKANVMDTTVVIGSGADAVRARFANDGLQFVEQTDQRGTGHAALKASENLKPGPGYTFIAAGDMPLLTSRTISEMFEQAEKQQLDCVLLSAIVKNPEGYGRVVRDESGQVVFIVEHADADSSQREIREINASCYCVKTDLLLSILPTLEAHDARGEYSLADIIEKIRARGGAIAAYIADEDECLGVNDCEQLYEASSRLYERTARLHMKNGVIFLDAKTAYIDPMSIIGPGTTVYPGVVLENGCEIGEGVILYPGSRISHSTIGDRTTVQNSVMLDSKVGSDTTVGPYAYLRPGSNVGSKCRVGDFVELKNCNVGDTTKISHLTYVGDADLGTGINIGCGTVFVNYDGKKKYRTTVGNDVFIGCNTNLVSPVKVGQGAYIAAGSTITEDVPEGTLAIARARQVIKTDWTDKRS